MAPQPLRGSEGRPPPAAPTHVPPPPLRARLLRGQPISERWAGRRGRLNQWRRGAAGGGRGRAPSTPRLPAAPRTAAEGGQRAHGSAPRPAAAGKCSTAASCPSSSPACCCWAGRTPPQVALRSPGGGGGAGADRRARLRAAPWSPFRCLPARCRGAPCGTGRGAAGWARLRLALLFPLLPAAFYWGW